MKILNKPVLILNKSWIPIRIKTVKSAIIMSYRDKATIVDPVNYNTYSWSKWIQLAVLKDEDCIHSANQNIKIPEIIILSKYNKVPQYDVKLTKRNIFLRDNFKCQYTGKKVNSTNGDIDHIMPISRGGKTTWDNLVVTFKDINRKKSNKTLQEAGLKLNKMPIKPTTQALMRNRVSDYPESWQKFFKQ